jgi:hypothetical protein
MTARIRFKHSTHIVIKHLKDYNSRGQVLKEFIQLSPAGNSSSNSNKTSCKLHCSVCEWPFALAEGARAIAVTPDGLVEHQRRV